MDEGANSIMADQLITGTTLIENTRTISGNLELIETKTISGTAIPSFSNFSGYSYVVLIIDTRKGGATGTDNQLYVRFNTDTGNNYEYRYISNVAVATQSATSMIMAGSDDYRFGAFTIQIKARHGVHGISCGGTGATGANRSTIQGKYVSTEDITSIEFFNDGTESADGETGQVSLYGYQVKST